MGEAGETPDECVNPAHEPAWEDDDDVYFACPERFIPISIIRWYDQYRYEKEFGTRIEYSDRSHKYIDAVQLYNKFTVYWTDIMKQARGNHG
jgi:hypothetical protein